MKKIFKNLLVGITPMALLPLAMISCRREDYEDIKNDDPNNNQKKKEDFKANAEPTKKIYEIYDRLVLPLFKDVKDNYFKYKVIWNELIKNKTRFKKKLVDLSNQQTIADNETALRDFLRKWFPDANSNKGEYKKFGMYLYKYELIYQDVDAVLADTNLAFSGDEFIKYLKTIDDRLKGSDIDLATLQSALISLWKFINSYVFNPNKITKEEDIEKQNLEDNKNSHTHSHAIINLIHEMGLWHKKLGETYESKDKNGEFIKNEFAKDFEEKTEPKIVDNVNHIDWKTNWTKIKETLKEFDNKSPNYDLTKQEFKDRGQEILNSLKILLEQIAKSQGLPNLDLK